MTLSEFVNEWNIVFELKITLAQAKKPTHSFIFEVLQFFLTNIRIDCVRLKANKDERQYKILLVKYFDGFFKACNYPCNFTYADFMQPVSRKTVKILRFLHNYLLFYTKVQEEVVETANDKVKLYNQLLSKKNQLQLQQEELKIRSQRKELALKECTRSIAEYKQLLEDLEVKSTLLTKDTDNATQQIHCIRDENLKLTCEINELNSLVVSEDEQKSLTKSVTTADDHISQLNSIEENLLSKNQCYIQKINRMGAELDEFSKISNETNVADLAERYRDEIKNVTEMTKKIKEFQNRIESLTTSREEILESTQSLEGQLVKKRNDLKSIVESSQIKTTAMESEYKRGTIHTSNLQKKLEIAEQQVEDLKAAQEHLITMGIEVLDHIKNS